MTCSYNCDPDKRKRSFPSFVDKLPVSCFRLTVRYEFPKDCVHYFIFVWVISHVLFDAAEETISCDSFNLETAAALYFTSQSSNSISGNTMRRVSMLYKW